MNKNREIKFRVWSKVKNSWLNSICIGESGLPLVVYIELNYKQEIINKVFTLDGLEPIIQQFTGLKDENGKDIYEGDIMASRGNHMTDLMDENGDYLDIYSVVVWNKRMTRFALKPIDEYLEQLKNPINPELDHPWVCSIDTFKEVIGNIYENPDMLPKLLEKQKQDEEKARKILEDITDECEVCGQYAVIDGFCNHCGYEER